jgi:hypothetical protein
MSLGLSNTELPIYVCQTCATQFTVDVKRTLTLAVAFQGRDERSKLHSGSRAAGGAI